MQKKGMKPFGISLIALLIIALIIVGFVIFSNKSPATSNAIASGNSNLSIKEFNMTANQHEFLPGIINVNRGDTVILHIISLDIDHGIAIPQFGVSQDLPPGQEKTIQFVANKTGNYTFFCNVYCGQGHKEMTGILVVN